VGTTRKKDTHCPERLKYHISGYIHPNKTLPRVPALGPINAESMGRGSRDKNRRIDYMVMNSAEHKQPQPGESTAVGRHREERSGVLCGAGQSG
jgi:hypothetical protein